MRDIGNREVMGRNITRLMNEAGKTRRDVCKDLGFSYSTFTEWVNGKKYPRIDKIEMLANYFNVEKSDLIEEKKKPATDDGNELSKRKKDFIERVTAMSDSELDRLDQILRLVEGTKEED